MMCGSDDPVWWCDIIIIPITPGNVVLTPTSILMMTTLCVDDIHWFYDQKICVVMMTDIIYSVLMMILMMTRVLTW